MHDAGHESINGLFHAMRLDTKKVKVVVGVNPGFMRTERVPMQTTSEEVKKQFRFDLSDSPEYVGRAIAALAADPAVSPENGQLLWASDLASEYGCTYIDRRWIPIFDPKAPLREPA